MHIANITTAFSNGAILFFSFLFTLLILALFLPSDICFARLSLSVPALYLRLESFDSSHEPLSSSFWSRLFIFPSSNTYNIIVISAITAATLSVTFGLNVKNILSNMNIGTARSADPAKYLPTDTGKSADTFPVWPLTVAYATLSLFLYDRNHTGYNVLSTDSITALHLDLIVLSVS